MKETLKHNSDKSAGKGGKRKYKHIHLIAICGTGMGSLAALLVESGENVSGSDQAIFPPMSDQLARLGITIREGYKPENLAPDVDLVIIGNAIPRTNPMIAHVFSRQIPYLSFPQAISEFFLADRHSIVVAGTHGKTTTTSMLAWGFEHAGFGPGFLIGGIPVNFGISSKLGKPPFFIIEGDEYDTAFFDKGAKFFHYQPKTLLINAIEFDHADIFASLSEILDAFRKLVSLMDENGCIFAVSGDANVEEIIKNAACPTVRFGIKSDRGWSAKDIAESEGATCFTVLHDGKPQFDIELPMCGNFNVSNALGAIAVMRGRGISPEVIQAGFAGFQGVKRRQEIRGEASGVTVIDDFAHHPTAVQATIRGLRTKYPASRIIAVFEPRSASCRRNTHQEKWPDAFEPADLFFLAPVFKGESMEEHVRLDRKAVISKLAGMGTTGFACSSSDEIIERYIERTRPGDVVVIMSPGGFDNIHERLLAALSDLQRGRSDGE